ncbi:MAG: septum formation initiator family protein [Candidatus Omnitrophica bacterium]|nr:septum formation initiator family protein [Candidatus Omnitrophota bacterium]
MIRNALFLCIVCALVFAFYLPSYIKMQDMNKKNQVYEKRIKDLEQDNARLGEERRRLTDDPAYFEKVAREKMGIIRDGEIVYKIVGPGQRKNGVVSEEASFILKPDGDADADDKTKAAVKPAAGAKVKPVVKAAVKPAVKTAAKTVVKAKVASTKTVIKKDSKAVVKKPAPTVEKKNVKAPAPKSSLKEITKSTKQ